MDLHRGAVRARHFRRAVSRIAMLVAGALAFAAAGVAGETSAPPAEASVTVFAAASLTNALEALSARWTQQGHAPFKLVAAASSTLARQIENGADPDIYVSADEEWMDYLVKRNFVTAASVRRPIGNALVLIAPQAPARTLPATPAARLDRQFAFTAALETGRLAVGDPAHVPAGRYARQALEAMGWWQAAEPRLARAENVRAALALVERGETPLGIVYATDARASARVRVLGTFPAASHDPIRYSFAALRGHELQRVREAFDFLTGPGSRDAYAAQGFTVE